MAIQLADPADIAEFTVDGVLLTLDALAVQAAYPNAVDEGDSEIEMFFDDPDDAAVLLAERFSLVSRPLRPHEAVEVDDAISIGQDTIDAGALPQFQVIDATRHIDVLAITVGLAFDMSADRYSTELVGIGSGGTSGTIDSTSTTIDSTSVTIDETS